MAGARWTGPRTLPEVPNDDAQPAFWGADYTRGAAIGCPPANVRGESGRACQYRTVDEFELRAATPADADAVAGYHHRCFTTTYSSQLLAGEFEAPDLAGTREQLRDWFQPGSEFETRVAVVDGAPIGHVTVRGHQLVHLFVEPDHQRMGLGRHLLGHGEAMIAAAGHTDFDLHARVENLAAIAFYENAGWSVIDGVIHTVEHGISYNERILVKRGGPIP